ncbi:MAG: D-hexose-6-phosphate mutarotase [Haemophilus parainfluenzae]|nr:D-hexose-6-phosphate mutarotase [Haemophilus parainfluenzae]
MTAQTQQLTPELTLEHINEIPVLILNHSVGTARIALQGAQLLNWQPKGAEQDIFWLSEIEPFTQGVAIRGGVPICYPWFGGVKQPSHGTAHLRLWQLSDYDLQANKVRLEFSLFSEYGVIEAKILGQEPAQAALHSYFNIGDISQIEVQNLPNRCYDSLQGKHTEVPATRRIEQSVDCIYSLEENKTLLVDKAFNRRIQITHHYADSIVLWNPWEKTPSAMQPKGYRTMVCIETARLEKLLQFGESISAEISALPADI